jgi:hypothetical protein
MVHLAARVCWSPSCRCAFVSIDMLSEQEDMLSVEEVEEQPRYHSKEPAQEQAPRSSSSRSRGDGPASRFWPQTDQPDCFLECGGVSSPACSYRLRAVSDIFNEVLSIEDTSSPEPPVLFIPDSSPEKVAQFLQCLSQNELGRNAGTSVGGRGGVLPLNKSGHSPGWSAPPWEEGEVRRRILILDLLNWI